MPGVGILVSGIAETRDGAHEDLPSKLPYRAARAGDKFIAIGPCGGGYGDALARDPEAVLDDVLDGYLSADMARADYAVVISDGTVDTAATKTLRAERQAAE